MKRDSRASAGRDAGAVTVMVVLALVTLLAMAALAVDVGKMLVTRTQLQNAADATALAAAWDLPDAPAVQSRAAEYAALNDNGSPDILDPSDVELGNFDLKVRTFSPSASPLNAVRVRVERSAARGNAVPLTFARVVGRNTADVGAVAIAYSPSGGVGTRFLIDEEMIDSDVPAVEELAADLGEKPEDLISDGDGDWFIDLPPGEELTLPTGQVGDAGLFDVSHPAFPFSNSSNPSHEDFLNFNEDGSWRQSLVPKEMLDPLLGVVPVEDPADYPKFVDPEFCNVSPVAKSDINELNPVGGDPAVDGDGDPAVNFLGSRRGLLAFSVIAIGNDPDGPSGSKLPDIRIRTCDPPPIEDVLSPLGSGARVVLVQ